MVFVMTTMVTSCNKSYHSKSHDFPKGRSMDVAEMEEIMSFPEPVDYDAPTATIKIYRIKFYS
jgi:hypothetical protein